jgi:hypothetical protein
MIRMRMPCPWRYDEKVIGLPREALTVDERITLSLEDVIGGAIHLPMHPGVHAWADELDPTGDGRQRWAAGA